MSSESWVEALKIEREGYVRTGKADRVAQVDEQLARYGEAAEKRQESGEKDAPRSRRGPRKSAT